LYVCIQLLAPRTPSFVNTLAYFVYSWFSLLLAGQRLQCTLLFLLVDIIVLALAARVNLFQDFFFVADLFPLALSIITLVLVSLLICIDLLLERAYTGRAQFEIGFFGVLSIFWLAFNAFSTSRWRQVPLQCSVIPDDFADERTWCKDLQALKAFVWINFLLCFCVAFFTLRYAVAQHLRGNKHVFKVSLSRFRPEASGGHGRSSEFLQFEKIED